MIKTHKIYVKTKGKLMPREVVVVTKKKLTTMKKEK